MPSPAAPGRPASWMVWCEPRWSAAARPSASSRSPHLLMAHPAHGPAGAITAGESRRLCSLAMRQEIAGGPGATNTGNSPPPSPGPTTGPWPSGAGVQAGIELLMPASYWRPSSPLKLCALRPPSGVDAAMLIVRPAGRQERPSWAPYLCAWAMLTHSLALSLWLMLVVLKVLQWQQRWRARSTLALSRSFRAELERRRQLRLPR